MTQQLTKPRDFHQNYLCDFHLRPSRILFVKERAQNYHYLALCIFQIMEAVGGEDVGGGRVTVHDGANLLCERQDRRCFFVSRSFRTQARLVYDYTCLTYTCTIQYNARRTQEDCRIVLVLRQNVASHNVCVT